MRSVGRGRGALTCGMCSCAQRDQVGCVVQGSERGAPPCGIHACTYTHGTCDCVPLRTVHDCTCTNMMGNINRHTRLCTCSCRLKVRVVCCSVPGAACSRVAVWGWGLLVISPAQPATAHHLTACGSPPSDNPPCTSRTALGSGAAARRTGLLRALLRQHLGSRRQMHCRSQSKSFNKGVWLGWKNEAGFSYDLQQGCASRDFTAKCRLR